MTALNNSHNSIKTIKYEHVWNMMGGVDDGELIGECSMTVVHVHMFTILSSISRQQQILDLAIPLLSNSKILHDCKTLQDSITSLFKIDSMPL